MSQFTKLLAVFTLSVFTFTACVAPSENDESHSNSTESEEEVVVDESTLMEEDEEESSEENKEDESSEAEEETAEEVEEVSLDEDPEFVAYTASQFADLEGSQGFAVFFHADWCPTCIGLEKDLEANIGSFPRGAKILEANFDTELDLRKKYGVNVQSTVVIIDKNGNEVKTLAAPSAAEIKAELMEVL